ncbi:MAG: hypothetical protein AB7U44_08050 [Sulfuricurvum sp.]|uniref:hypothetical protein n=1 Tax=Sulfuricurvum sp. TaxID=2025608 RepID=UPI00261B2D14|nr:hypothetical protein [Sulfuricurvum sp.]MDD3596213.1 hypothetical protein [Sulfuricurvum sp.]
MIKLLLLLLPLSLLHAQSVVYLLPDEQSRLIHDINLKVKTASSDILLLTPAFHHAAIKKSILAAAKKGTTVKLIVNEPKNDPVYMVQYANIDLMHYRERKFEGSTLVIDKAFLCTFPEAIDQEIFSEHRSLVRCSDDPREIDLIRRTLQSTLSHAVSYLE